MKQFTTFYLKDFKGGLHLARGLRNAYDKSHKVVHSDMLKSAIFVNALELFGTEKISEIFLKSFKVSSCFPFYKSNTVGEILHFFPSPASLGALHQVGLLEEGMEKQIRKVEWIEQSDFEYLLSGAASQLALSKSSIAGSFLSQTKKPLTDLVLQDDCKYIIKSDPFQHVSIDRNHAVDSVPFYVDKIYFHENAGLFFLVSCNNAETLKLIAAAMRLLADTGIGTDRNNGNGQFSLCEGELNLDVPEDANYELNLSLYLPEKEEIPANLDDTFFGLIKRGGYISSPQNSNHLTIRKRSVYMFKEGSVFPKPDKPRNGKIVDLKPDFATLNHPIYRDGQSIFLPIKL